MTVREDVNRLLDEARSEMTRILDDPLEYRRQLQLELAADLVDTGSAMAVAAGGSQDRVDLAHELVATGRLLATGFKASPTAVLARVRLRLKMLNLYKNGGQAVRTKWGDAQPRRVIPPFEPDHAELSGIFSEMYAAQQGTQEGKGG